MRIILIRHGETQKDKSNPNRTLTQRGKDQINKSSTAIKKYINADEQVLILYSPSHRTKETAEFLRNYLQSKNIMLKPSKLKIQNAHNIGELIETNKLIGIRPAETYLGLEEWQDTESPTQLTQRWLKEVERYSKFDVLILVSHEASLEAFLYNQNKYNLNYKSFEYYFEYGDFAILEEFASHA